MVTNTKPRRRPRITVLLASALSVLLSSSLVAAPAFAEGEENAKLMMVLDASGSMAENDAGGQTRIAAARQALGTVIDDLPEGANVGMRVFGATVDGQENPGACTDSQKVVDIGGNNRDQLRTASNYEPFGETPVGYALQEAGKDLGAEGQRSILLLSDGESNCDPDPCQVAKDLAAGGVDLSINVVGLNVNDAARKQLQCIADSGRGSYFDAKDADSLTSVFDRLASRAFRPFSLAGTPIKGTPTADGAPEVKPGEQYTDTMAAVGKSKNYVVTRTMPGSTIHVGMSAIPSQAGTESAGLNVSLSTTEGDDCDSGSSLTSDSLDYRILSAGAASPPDTESPCFSDDQLVIEVGTMDDWGNGEGVPFEMVIQEEPPIVTGYGAAKALAAPEEWSLQGSRDGSDGAIEPGSSFNDATLLEPGSYTADIVGLETQFFRVPVDWGQDVRIFWEIPPAGGSGFGDIALYSPSRADVLSSSEGEGSLPRAYAKGIDSPYGAETGYAAASTAPVAWANRLEISDPQAAANRPGDYFVALTMGSSAGADIPVEGVTFPYTLTIERTGTAGEGAPQYAEGAAPVTAEPSASAEEPTEEAEAPAAPDESSGLPPFVAIALGVLGVLLLAGGVIGLILWRLSRARTSAPDSAPAEPPTP